jgi:hypothetical protein
MTSLPIAAARALGSGARVTVEGIVTAEAGRIGLPPQLSIQDATGAIVVRLPDGAPRPARGTMVRVTGKLTDPYGQLEVRPATAADVTVAGLQALPDPSPASAASLGEATEARLAVLEGTLEAVPTRETSGDLVLRVVDDAGVPFRARATRSAGIEPTVARPGSRLRLTGIIGQRASRKGALDGYRLWLRDAYDLAVVAGPLPAVTPGAGTAPRPGASPAGSSEASVRPIAAVLRLSEGPVRIEAVVTIPATLLDASGRRVVVQDASGAVELLLPIGQAAPRPGSRLQVEGEIGTAYGAPRIRVAAVRVLGSGAVPAPRALPREPGSGDEGELVRISGRIVDLQRLGDRWRADVRTGGGTVVVAGLSGAGIPAATMAEGAGVAVVGIVRRPHPAATDRRFAVVPRGPGDVRADGSVPPAADAGPASSRSVAGPGGSPSLSGIAAVVDADLATLGALAGARVRVGGIVVDVDGDRMLVDDGTAAGRIQLVDGAAAILPLLEPGDAVSAIGLVVGTDGEALVRVDDPAGVARLGDLGEPLPLDPETPTLAAVGAPQPSARPTLRGPAGALRAIDSGPGPAPLGAPLVAGAGLALLASGAGATLAALRRRRDRRRVAARISTRLEALAVPSRGATASPPAPPRGLPSGPPPADVARASTA